MDKCKSKSVEIIENNIDIVATIAHKFENDNMSYEDLASIGCIGLIKAANTIEQRGDMGIYTYIVSMIEKEIYRFLKYRDSN